MKWFRKNKKRIKKAKTKKIYSGVRKQQGRVTLDDDWNEDSQV